MITMHNIYIYADH